MPLHDTDALDRALAARGPFALLDALGVRHTREGRSARLACPFHDERTPSATFGLGPEGTLRLHCFGACGRSWDALALVAVARGFDVEHDFAAVAAEGARLAGLAAPPIGASTSARREPPPPEPPRYAPAAELRALLGRSASVVDDAPCCDALAARGINPGLVADLGLAVALPRDHELLPRWARKAGRPWGELGYRLGLAAYAVQGPSEAPQSPTLEICGIRAWCVDPNRAADLPKRVAPAGCEMRGLFLACPTARRYLQAGEPCRLVVVEGEPDFLSLATTAALAGRAWGVVGVVAGSWTQALADLVPEGSVVATATHDDAAGDRYAKAVADSAKGRFEVVRAPPERDSSGEPSDLNDMLRAGTLEAFDPFKGAPELGGLPPGEVDGRTALVEFLRAFREGRPKLRPISTGFLDLDHALHGGYRRGDLWILGGRTSQGKTSCAFSGVASKLSAPSPDPCAVWSVETMDDDALARLLARQSGLSLSRMRSPAPGTEQEMAALVEAANPLVLAPWRLGSRARRRGERPPPMTVEMLGGRVAAFVAHARRAGYDTALIVVDYVQRLAKSNGRHTVREHVMHVCAELKDLAMAEGIAVMALSQVSREVDGRDDKRPTLGDLSESSSLEQDADGVIAVYRPGYYDRDADPTVAELLILKNRHGPVDRVRVRWRPETASYHDDWAPEPNLLRNRTMKGKLKCLERPCT